MSDREQQRISYHTLPPSQQTLTQMSRERETKHKMDSRLLTSIRNVQKRESKSFRSETRVEARGSASIPVGEQDSSSSEDDDFVRRRQRRRVSADTRGMGIKKAKEPVEHERALSPCLLPPSPDDNSVNQRTIWTVDPGEAPPSPPPSPDNRDHDFFPPDTHDSYIINGVRHIFPKRKHINVHTKEWTAKYNALLTKCKEYEKKYLLEKRKTRYYRDRLEAINDLSKIGPTND